MRMIIILFIGFWGISAMAQSPNGGQGAEGLRSMIIQGHENEKPLNGGNFKIVTAMTRSPRLEYFFKEEGGAYGCKVALQWMTAGSVDIIESTGNKSIYNSGRCPEGVDLSKFRGYFTIDFAIEFRGVKVKDGVLYINADNNILTDFKETGFVGWPKDLRTAAKLPKDEPIKNSDFKLVALIREWHCHGGLRQIYNIIAKERGEEEENASVEELKKKAAELKKEGDCQGAKDMFRRYLKKKGDNLGVYDDMEFFYPEECEGDKERLQQLKAEAEKYKKEGNCNQAKASYQDYLDLLAEKKTIYIQSLKEFHPSLCDDERLSLEKKLSSLKLAGDNLMNSNECETAKRKYRAYQQIEKELGKYNKNLDVIQKLLAPCPEKEKDLAPISDEELEKRIAKENGSDDDFGGFDDFLEGRESESDVRARVEDLDKDIEDFLKGKVSKADNYESFSEYKNGEPLYGFRNKKTKKVIISAQYDKVEKFEDGIAKVSILMSKESFSITHGTEGRKTTNIRCYKSWYIDANGDQQNKEEFIAGEECEVPSFGGFFLTVNSREPWEKNPSEWSSSRIQAEKRRRKEKAERKEREKAAADKTYQAELKSKVQNYKYRYEQKGYKWKSCIY